MKFSAGIVALGTAAVFLAACSVGAPQANVRSAQGVQSRSGAVKVFAANQPLAAVAEFGTALREVRTQDTALNYRPDNGKSHAGLYVSEFYGHAIYEYLVPNPKNHGPICDIYNSEFVNGLGVDASGVLWVPLGNDGRVRSFSHHCGAPGMVLRNPDGQATDVAFNNATGTIYVDNAQSANQGPGFINVYRKGNRRPYKRLRNSNVYRSVGVAVNEKGELFQSFISQGGSVGVLEYPNGVGAGKVLALSGISHPAGLTFDRHGNLIVVDVDLQSLLIFASPYSGSPRSTIGMRGTPVYAKLNKKNSRLYASNYDAGTVDVYTYPAGRYLYSISKYLYQPNYVEGVAIDPASD